MAAFESAPINHIFRPVALVVALALCTATPPAFASDHKPTAESTLVRVDIFAQSGGGDPVEINGRRITDYRPKIIQIFRSIGVVLDDQTHILTFLGYRWVEMASAKPNIQIITAEGTRYSGKLIGIDQSVGAAVVLVPRGSFSKTPLCERCDIRDGSTIVTRVFAGPSAPQLQPIQIRSVGQGQEAQDQDGWEVTLNQPLLETGGPIMDAEHRVLGFVASQQPSQEDPTEVRTIVYPITQLLRSARKILRADGDIRTGWLGIFLEEPSQATRQGVKIKSVLKDSPASEAGLQAEDVLLKWNGRDIRDSRHFIRMVQDTPIGSKATVALSRGNRPLSVVASIEARRSGERTERFSFTFPMMPPPSGRLRGSETERMAVGRPARIGIETTPLTTQLAEFLKIQGQTGLLVVSVEAQTPFERAGVQVGDVILTTDQQLVRDPQAFVSLIQARMGGAPLLLKLLRKGNIYNATVQIPQSYPPPPRKH